MYSHVYYFKTKKRLFSHTLRRKTTFQDTSKSERQLFAPPTPLENTSDYIGAFLYRIPCSIRATSVLERSPLRVVGKRGKSRKSRINIYSRTLE